MKQLDKQELETLERKCNRAAVFSKGDCERAAISFASQVNGVARQEFTDRGYIYWVFWRKQ